MAHVQVLLPFTPPTSFIHFIYYSCLYLSKNVLSELSLVAMCSHDRNGMEQHFLSAIKGLGRVNDASEPVNQSRSQLRSAFKMAAHPRFNFPRRLGVVPNDFPFPNPNVPPIQQGNPRLNRYSQVQQGVDLIRADVLRYILGKIVLLLEYSAVTSVTQCNVTGTYTVTISCRCQRFAHVGFAVAKTSTVEGMLSINYFLCSIVHRR